ncbi:hypothetical protein ACIRNI_28515 [Streptomyces sp. NPDC093546]|uniref:hypothetical protein n=1 Tax=Streptomyces sp. NPDC093546 TaxID=3366040 RepID=UPI00382127AA
MQDDGEWTTSEFGESHTGRVGVVLADGTEPDAVYLDAMSSGAGHHTRYWAAYDGRLGPRAAALRAACSCGWRGTTLYPIDWEALDSTSLHQTEIDTDPAINDWDNHIGEVEARAVPIPEPVVELLDRLNDELRKLAHDSPSPRSARSAACRRLPWTSATTPLFWVSRRMSRTGRALRRRSA